MSVISKTKNPATRKDMIIASGLIDYIKLDPHPADKVNANGVKEAWIKIKGQPDKKIESTHRASIVLKDPEDMQADGVWIGFGDVKLHPQHQNLQVKDDDDKFVTLVKGIEISCEVSQTDAANGKTYYNSTKGKINILSMENAVAEPSQKNTSGSSQGPAKTYTKRDNSGMEIGHAINGALNLKRAGATATEVELAKIVHEVTVALKKEEAERQGKDVSDYDVGASVGHAVLNATRDFEPDAKTGIEDQLKNYANNLLSEVVPEISAFVRGETPKEKVVEKKETKTRKVKEEKPPVNEEEYPDLPMDFDDDIPF